MRRFKPPGSCLNREPGGVLHSLNHLIQLILQQ